MNILEQLRLQTKVVTDTGDLESVKKFKPVDATTNPSLIYTAAQNSNYAPLIDDAIAYAKRRTATKQDLVSLAVDKLFVDFGLEILKMIPGRVSTEADARLSFDTEGTVKKARELISLYDEAGIDRSRILIKIASTWEGIKAAEQLTQEGIHCNMTLLFSLSQAIASAEAGVQLVSPFIGRILDWYTKYNKENHLPPAEEPGVILVKEIYNYYKKFGFRTEVMAASFRNIEEIMELSGCDLMTIAPEFLAELEQKEGVLERKLFPDKPLELSVEKLQMDEKTFRWMLNENIMASEKLAEGIRKFTVDLLKLEGILLKKCE
jgi:transaldolase